jgi:hypothetical protein
MQNLYTAGALLHKEKTASFFKRIHLFQVGSLMYWKVASFSVLAVLVIESSLML